MARACKEWQLDSRELGKGDVMANIECQNRALWFRSKRMAYQI